MWGIVCGQSVWCIQSAWPAVQAWPTGNVQMKATGHEGHKKQNFHVSILCHWLSTSCQQYGNFLFVVCVPIGLNITVASWVFVCITDFWTLVRSACLQPEPQTRLHPSLKANTIDLFFCFDYNINHTALSVWLSMYYWTKLPIFLFTVLLSSIKSVLSWLNKVFSGFLKSHRDEYRHEASSCNYTV